MPGSACLLSINMIRSLCVYVYPSISMISIDIESLQNRLLKVCYVPATSASLRNVSFFFPFLFLLLQPLTVLMKQTRQAVRAVKQSIFLDVYDQGILKGEVSLYN